MINDKRVRDLASRMSEDDWKRVMPTVALVHSRTGVVAGKGIDEAAATLDALDVGVMPGGLWVFRRWVPEMRKMMMERT